MFLGRGYHKLFCEGDNTCGPYFWANRMQL